MGEYIAFDSHKHYTFALREDQETGRTKERRIEHAPGAICAYLKDAAAGTPVAVETMGSWYWIVTEIEKAGLQPMLVHARKAKLMMGMINKTDKLDARGLNRLQRNGTLPAVWIPPAELRDLRELTRTRMVLVRQRTRLKNRLQATLEKYGLQVEGCSDVFGVGARRQWTRLWRLLPPQTRWTAQALLDQLDFVERQIKEFEERQRKLLVPTEEMMLLTTLPGVGPILGAVMALEIGDVGRFLTDERLASYSGTTPRVQASGDKTRYGRLRPDVNRYLKWAFVEAANVAAWQSSRHPNRHVSLLYHRLRLRKGHAKAVGAVARHLAEAAYHVLRKKEPYRDPTLGRTSKA